MEKLQEKCSFVKCETIALMGSLHGFLHKSSRPKHYDSTMLMIFKLQASLH